ncbi:hypothetical protein DFH09DRAFT_1457502 [Mycena vulgaris]|nr:hypothetical protein DFH09DRAFT_1457502 [Mycena vulgaris]
MNNAHVYVYYRCPIHPAQGEETEAKVYARNYVDTEGYRLGTDVGRARRFIGMTDASPGRKVRTAFVRTSFEAKGITNSDLAPKNGLAAGGVLPSHLEGRVTSPRGDSERKQTARSNSVPRQTPLNHAGVPHVSSGQTRLKGKSHDSRLHQNNGGEIETLISIIHPNPQGGHSGWIFLKGFRRHCDPRVLRSQLYSLSHSQVSPQCRASSNVSSFAGLPRRPNSPPELLLEIFLLCKPDTFKCPLNDKAKHFEKQFPVLYVNSHWRAAALSSLPPTLLQLYLSTASDPAVRTRTDTLILSRLRNYLASDGALPLNFHVHYYVASRSPQTDELPFEILMLLCAHSARWENISLHLLPSMYGAIAATMRGPFPRLKSIELRETEPDFRPRAPPSPSFLDAPQLSTLNVGFMGQRSANVSIPWAQLTCITLSFPNPPTFHRVLTDCPNLRECTLKDYNRTSTFWRPPPGPPLTHAALRKLRFKSANLSHFLPLVHAPNVDEVHSDSAIFRPEDAEALLTLPALRKLHMQFVFFNAKEAAQYLPLVRVPELELELLQDMPDGALRALEENGSLERLRLKFKKTADEESLIRLAQRREELALHVEAGISSETIERLWTLLEDGREISGLARCAILAEEVADSQRGVLEWTVLQGMKLYDKVVNGKQ